MSIIDAATKVDAISVTIERWRLTKKADNSYVARANWRSPTRRGHTEGHGTTGKKAIADCVDKLPSDTPSGT